jgi:hypothetical protein
MNWIPVRICKLHIVLATISASIVRLMINFIQTLLSLYDLAPWLKAVEVARRFGEKGAQASTVHLIGKHHLSEQNHRR